MKGNLRNEKELILQNESNKTNLNKQNYKGLREK